MDLSPLQLVLATLAVAVGSMVQGSLGFGSAVLAAPFLVLVDASFVPGPTITFGLVLTTLIALRERASVDLRGVGWALAGRVPGTLAGVLVLLWVPADELETLIAALMLLAVALTGAGLRLEPHRGTLFGAGIASGIMGTVASVGGPAVALVYQHAPGPTLRGTMAGYFIVSSAISLVALLASGLFGMREVLATAALLPGTLLGFFLSRWTRTALDGGHTRKGVLALSAIAAIGLMVKSFG